MFRFVVLALAVTSASAGLVLPRLPLNVLLRGNVPLVDPAIVGGTEAQPHEFPWQVSLRGSSDAGSAHYCGGSVIDESTVITASHCVDGDIASNVHVVAGAHKRNTLNGNEQYSIASSLITHPQFIAGTFYNDIAIIKLVTPFTYTDAVQAVKLPAAGQQTNPGDVLTATGWGATSEDYFFLPNTLMKVDVPAVSDDECRAAHGQNEVADSMICAGESGKDTCDYDSGSPLTNAAGELIGIGSWGYGCGRPGYPGVYTEVSYFIDFINSHL